MSKAKGNNFVTNPKGNASGGAKPQSLVADTSIPQKAGEDYTINPQSVPSGGKLPFPTPAADSGNPINTGKPFKVGG